MAKGINITMKKTIMTLVLGLMCAASSANDQLVQQMMDQMLESAKAEAKKACESSEYLRCAGLSGSQCVEFAAEVYDKCLSQIDMSKAMVDESYAEQLQNCPLEVAKQNGIDIDKLNKCDLSNSN